MADDLSLNQALTQQLARRALANATPATVPYLTRSAYLADALRQIGETGAQNLRTPKALVANLLADALAEWGSRRADAALQAHAATDTGHPATASDDGDTADADAPQTDDDVADASGAGQSAGMRAAAARKLAAAAFSPAARELVARMLLHEAAPPPSPISRRREAVLAPRPLQISTGPDPSLPPAGVAGPSGAAPPPPAPQPAAPTGMPAGAAPPPLPTAAGAALFPAPGAAAPMTARALASPDPRLAAAQRLAALRARDPRFGGWR